MSPKQRAERTLADAFGSPAGWEHVGRQIEEGLRAAVLEEREMCAQAAEDLAPADNTDSRFAGATEASRRIATAIRSRT